MQVTEIRTEGLSREFKIAVPAEDIERKLVDRLEKLARSVRMPGFRPGKVPVSLLRKKYGDALKGEILEETVNDSSSTIVSDRGLRPAATPRIEITAFDDGADLEYTMAIDVLPEIEPPDYSAIELERLVAEPDEQSVDRVLANIARALGTETVVGGTRKAQSGDIAVVDYTGLVDGQAFEGSSGEGASIEIGGGHPIPGLDDELVGLGVGETKQVKLTLPSTFHVSAVAGKEATVDVKVTELKERVPAVLDDDLAVKLGLETIEELKNNVREDQMREIKAVTRMRLKRALLDRLAELYDFDVPNALLEREYANVARQLKPEPEQGAEADSLGGEKAEHAHAHAHAEHDHHHPDHVHDEHCNHGSEADQPADAHLSDEEKQEARSIAERRVRLGLVLAEVGRRNDLKVSEEELNRAIIAQARRFPGQEQAALEFLRKNAEARESMAAPIMEDKVVDFICELATVAERKVSVKELFKDPDEESEQPA